MRLSYLIAIVLLSMCFLIIAPVHAETQDDINAAIVADNRGDFDTAVRLYTSALDSSDLSRDAEAKCYFNRGLSYEYEQHYDKAIADFTKAIQLNSNDEDAYAERGVVYEEQKFYDNAISDDDDAIRLNPGDAVPYSNRGKVFGDENQNDKAIANFNEAIRLDPALVQAYINCAWAYHNMGDDAKGLTYADRAVALAPGDAGNIETRAVIYEQLGLLQKAKADYRTALKLDPHDNDAIAGLARLGVAPSDLTPPEASAPLAVNHKHKHKVYQAAADAVPDFTLDQVSNGRPFHLRSHIGQVVLIDFWATWCGPCRMAIPHLIELQKKYGGKNFTVVGVSLDQQGPDVVSPFFQQWNINYPVVVDTDGSLANEYGGIKAIPTTIVIDREGRVVGDPLVGDRPYEEYENLVRRALKAG